MHTDVRVFPFFLSFFKKQIRPHQIIHFRCVCNTRPRFQTSLRRSYMYHIPHPLTDHPLNLTWLADGLIGGASATEWIDRESQADNDDTQCDLGTQPEPEPDMLEQAVANADAMRLASAVRDDDSSGRGAQARTSTPPPRTKRP